MLTRFVWMLLALVIVQHGTTAPLDEDAALARSQRAVGTVIGDHQLNDRHGRRVSLRTVFERPAVISLIYTSCHHTCPVITRRLAEASRDAREVLGANSFNVVTVGFDTVNDTPYAMRHFAKGQGVDDDHWYFLSADAATVAALVEETGFTYQPSPHGFDHLTQATVVEAGGTIYRQVYGETFELPWLVEPLKQLVFGQPVAAGGHLLDGLLGRIRLVCTVFDPATGRYRFDYTIFIQMAIGTIIVVAVLTYLIREAIRARRLNNASSNASGRGAS